MKTHDDICSGVWNTYRIVLKFVDHFKTEVNATSTPAAGDTVSMLCSLKRYGNPTQNIDIGWLDGEDVMDGNLTKSDTMVVNEVIRTLTPDDNGKEYHCKQSFSATIASQPGYEPTVVLGPLEVYCMFTNKLNYCQNCCYC